MKFSLIISTTNKHRRNALSSIVKSIYPNISVCNKNIPRTKISPESNKTAKENAIEKALFYGKYFNKNVLCEDDTLLVGPKELSIHRNKNKYLSIEEIYSYWSDLIRKEGPIEGKLIKAFAYNKNNKVVANQVEKEIKLLLPKTKAYRLCYNPLNHFIVPKGYSKSIAELSEKQLIRFRLPETFLLKRLLR